MICDIGDKCKRHTLQAAPDTLSAASARFGSRIVSLAHFVIPPHLRSPSRSMPSAARAVLMGEKGKGLLDIIKCHMI